MNTSMFARTSLSLLAALAVACGKSNGGDEATATTTVTDGTDGTGGSSETGHSSETGGSSETGKAPTTGDPGSTTDSTGGDPGPGIQPPEPGPMMPPDGVGSVSFAVTRLFFGDTDHNDVPDKDAWMSYGYDLDGKISVDGTDLCRPLAGADPEQVHLDGDSGIDNAFGQHILSILTALQADFAAKENNALMNGTYTLLFDLTQLGTGTDYNPLLARHYIGSDLGSAPNLDGSDAWPVDGSSLTDPADLLAAKLAFADSYVTGNTWVGHAPPDAVLTLRILGQVDLHIHHAVVTMELEPGHTAAANGTIAGIVPINDFVEELRQFGGSVDPSLCAGPTFDSLRTQIEQSADILLDGTQDPARDCEAFTIGIGFNAFAVQLGAITAAVPDEMACM